MLTFFDVRRMLADANSCVDDLFVDDINTKATWVITFKSGSTQAQKDVTVAYMNSIDVAATPAKDWVLSQDLIAQFTVADFTAIRSAVAANDQFGLLWASLQAQKDPMMVTNARFQAGWSALVQVLGQPRMTAIAAALGVTIA